MCTTILVGLPPKLPILSWNVWSEIFFGLLVLVSMVFIELFGIFVVSQESLVVLACFPLKNMALLSMKNGLSKLFLEMKPRRFMFGTVFLLASLLAILDGRGLVFKPFSSCVNQWPYRAPLLLRAFGKPRKLLSLGFVGLEMSFAMGSP